VKAAPTALMLAVALAGAAAGFFAYQRYSAGRPPPGQLVPATPAASAPASGPATAMPAAAIPEEIPDVSLPDLAGKPHRLRAAAGRARLFNFWATWCEPCRREIPLLNSLQSAHGAEGVQVTGIAVDFRDSVLDFLKTTKLDYALLVGEEDGLEVAQKFGVDLVLPFTVFADERNRIIAVKVGELHRAEAEAILANVRALEAGRLTLAGARSAIRAALEDLRSKKSTQSKP
jgi:thiol-disulfide isomerase/thioredoxin